MKGNKEKKSTVLVDGDLNVKNAESIKAMLLKVAGMKNALELKVENVKSLDLSFLQILFAFITSEKASGRKISVIFNLSDENKSLLTRSGFSQYFN